jgi:hypothetical protein
MNTLSVFKITMIFLGLNAGGFPAPGAAGKSVSEALRPGRIKGRAEHSVRFFPVFMLAAVLSEALVLQWAGSMTKRRALSE